MTTVDAELFAISSAAKEAGLILRKRKAREVDIVSDSPEALAAVSSATLWTSPLVGDTLFLSKQIRNQGCTSRLVQAPDDEDAEGFERCQYYSHSGGASAAAAATLGITVLRAAKRKRHKASSAQDEQVSRWLEEVSDGAIPRAEVGTRGDGSTPLQNEEGTRHSMLVVWQQTAER